MQPSREANKATSQKAPKSEESGISQHGVCVGHQNGDGGNTEKQVPQTHIHSCPSGALETETAQTHHHQGIRSETETAQTLHHQGIRSETETAQTHHHQGIRSETETAQTLLHQGIRSETETAQTLHQGIRSETETAQTHIHSERETTQSCKHQDTQSGSGHHRLLLQQQSQQPLTGVLEEGAAEVCWGSSGSSPPPHPTPSHSSVSGNGGLHTESWWTSVLVSKDDDRLDTGLQGGRGGVPVEAVSAGRVNVNLNAQTRFVHPSPSDRPRLPSFYYNSQERLRLPSFFYHPSGRLRLPSFYLKSGGRLRLPSFYFQTMRVKKGSEWCERIPDPCIIVFLVLNLLVLGLGIVMMVVGAKALTGKSELLVLINFDVHGHLQSKDHLGIVQMVLLSLLVVGAVITITAIMAVGGMFLNITSLLYVYLVVMVLVLIATISIVGFAVYFHQDLSLELAAPLEKVLKKNYDGKLNSSNTISWAFDYAQMYLGCCGGRSYKDFQSTKWLLNHRDKQVGEDVDRAFPLTCCELKDPVAFLKTTPTTSSLKAALNDPQCPDRVASRDNPYTGTPCAERVKQFLQDQAATTYYVGLAVMLLEMTSVTVVREIIRYLNKKGSRAMLCPCLKTSKDDKESPRQAAGQGVVKSNTTRGLHSVHYQGVTTPDASPGNGQRLTIPIEQPGNYHGLPRASQV